MSLPLVSIIMPAYNAEPYIAEAIKSIQRQTYSNWELLIADDCSSDNTRIIINSFIDSRIICFHNDVNLKMFKTRNKLLSKSRGLFIALMDADDISHPKRLEVQVQRFLDNDNLGLCGTWVERITRKGESIRVQPKPISHEEIRNELLKSNPIGEPTFMIRRKVIDELGFFRLYFDGLPYQGYDWSFLVCEKYECCNIPEVLYYYRMNPSSNSKILNPKRIVSLELVQHLGRQRRETGTDDLEEGRIDLVDQKMSELLKPYHDDPSLVFRHYAASFMYSKLYRKAIKASQSAVVAAPGRLVNYRTLAYCIRKTIAEHL